MLLHDYWSILHVSHSLCLFDFYRSALASAHQGQPLPKTLSVMESTPQVRGMHTIIRSEDKLTHNNVLLELKLNLSEKLGGLRETDIKKSGQNRSSRGRDILTFVAWYEWSSYIFLTWDIIFVILFTCDLLCVCVGTRRQTEMSLSSTPRD